jgi:hypothetical protein
MKGPQPKAIKDYMGMGLAQPKAIRNNARSATEHAAIARAFFIASSSS